MTEKRSTQRIDKWLWFARFFKTRGLAAKVVGAGHVRVNSGRISKAAHGVGAGDVLTFPQGRQIRVIEVAALGQRRGPAPEAQALYRDLAPPPPPQSKSDESYGTVGADAHSGPRAGPPPSKAERRSAAKLNRFDLE